MQARLRSSVLIAKNTNYEANGVFKLNKYLESIGSKLLFTRRKNTYPVLKLNELSTFLVLQLVNIFYYKTIH